MSTLESSRCCAAHYRVPLFASATPVLPICTHTHVPGLHLPPLRTAPLHSRVDCSIGADTQTSTVTYSGRVGEWCRGARVLLVLLKDRECTIAQQHGRSRHFCCLGGGGGSSFRVFANAMPLPKGLACRLPRAACKSGQPGSTSLQLPSSSRTGGQACGLMPDDCSRPLSGGRDGGPPVQIPDPPRPPPPPTPALGASGDHIGSYHWWVTCHTPVTCLCVRWAGRQRAHPMCLYSNVSEFDGEFKDD